MLFSSHSHVRKARQQRVPLLKRERRGRCVPLLVALFLVVLLLLPQGSAWHEDGGTLAAAGESIAGGIHASSTARDPSMPSGGQDRLIRFSLGEMTEPLVQRQAEQLVSSQRSKASAEAVANFFDILKQRAQRQNATQAKQAEGRSSQEAVAQNAANVHLASSSPLAPRTPHSDLDALRARRPMGKITGQNVIPRDGLARATTYHAAPRVSGDGNTTATRTPQVSVLSTEPAGSIGYGSTLSSLLLLGRFDETITAVYVDGVHVPDFTVESRYALRIERIPEHPSPPLACLLVFDPLTTLPPICGGASNGSQSTNSIAETPLSIVLTVSIEGEYVTDAHGAVIFTGANVDLVNVSFLLDGLDGHARLVRRTDYTPVLLAVRSPVAVMEAFAAFDASTDAAYFMRKDGRPARRFVPGKGSVTRPRRPDGLSTGRAPNGTLVWEDGQALSERGRRYSQQFLLRQYLNSSAGDGQRLQEREADISRLFARMGRITYSSVQERRGLLPGGFHTNPFGRGSLLPRPPPRAAAAADGEAALAPFAVVSPRIIPAEGFSANVTILFSVGETTGDVDTSATTASLTAVRDRYSLTRLLPYLTNTAMVQSVPSVAQIAHGGLRFVNSYWMYDDWIHTLTFNGAFPRTMFRDNMALVLLHPLRFPATPLKSDWYVTIDSPGGNCVVTSATNTEVSCSVSLSYDIIDDESAPLFEPDPLDSCGGGVAVTVAVQNHTYIGAEVEQRIDHLGSLFPLLVADEALFKPDSLFMTSPRVLSSLNNVARSFREQQAAQGNTGSATQQEDLTVTFTYSFIYDNLYGGDFRLHCFGSNQVVVGLQAEGDLVYDGEDQSTTAARHAAGAVGAPVSASNESDATRVTAESRRSEDAPRPHRRRGPPNRNERSTRSRSRESSEASFFAASSSSKHSSRKPRSVASANATACEVLPDAPLRHTRSSTTLSFSTVTYFNVSCTFPLSHLTNATLRGSLYCGVSLEASGIYALGGGNTGQEDRKLSGSVVVMEVSVPFADPSDDADDATLVISHDLGEGALSDGMHQNPLRLRLPQVTTAAECLVASTDLYLSTLMAGRRWWVGPGGGGIPILPQKGQAAAAGDENTGGADGPRCSWFIALPYDEFTPDALCRSPTDGGVRLSLTTPGGDANEGTGAFVDSVRMQQIYCGSRSFFMDPIGLMQMRVPLGFIPLFTDLDSHEIHPEEDLLFYHFCADVELQQEGSARPSAVPLPLRAPDGTLVGGGPLIYTIVDTWMTASEYMPWVKSSEPSPDFPQNARVFGDTQYYTGIMFNYYARGGVAPADANDKPLGSPAVSVYLQAVLLEECGDDSWVYPDRDLPVLSAYVMNDTTVALPITEEVPSGWYNVTMSSGEMGSYYLDCGVSLRVNFTVTGVVVPDVSPVGGRVLVTIRGHNFPTRLGGWLFVALGNYNESEPDPVLNTSREDALRVTELGDAEEDGSAVSRAEDGVYLCQIISVQREELQCRTPAIPEDEVRRLSVGRTRGNEHYMIPFRIGFYLDGAGDTRYELFQVEHTWSLPDGSSWFYIPYTIESALVTDISPRSVSCMNPAATITVTGVNMTARNVLLCQREDSAAITDTYTNCVVCLPRVFTSTSITCDTLDMLAPGRYYVFLADQITVPVPNFTVESVCQMDSLSPEEMYADGSDELIIGGVGFYPNPNVDMVVYVYDATDGILLAHLLRIYIVPILSFNDSTIIVRTPDLGSWLTTRVTVRVSLSFGSGTPLECGYLSCNTRVIPRKDMPMITSFSPLYGQAPLTITVYGRGFRKLDSSPSYGSLGAPVVASAPSAPASAAALGTYIDVGHGPCRIVDALNTRLVCQLEEPCYNSYPNTSLRLVAAHGVGSTAPAIQSDTEGLPSLFFVCSMSVNRIFPTRGSAEGGLPLTITGVGFPPDPSILSVTVAGFPCVITSVTVRDIRCNTTSTSGRAGSVTGSVVVLNTATSTRVTCCSFTYDSDITPTITSVYPLIGVRLSRVTITGTNFLPTGASAPGTGTEPAHVYVKIGNYMARETNLTSSEIRYNVSRSMFLADTVAVFVPGVGLSAPYHIQRPIGQGGSAASGLSPYDFFDPLGTGDAATAAGTGNTGSTTNNGGNECIEYPKLALVVTSAVTEPSTGGFQGQMLIRLVGTYLEPHIMGDMRDMFTVHVCGKPCLVTGTNAAGDVLCVVPDYMDEAFVAQYKSLLDYPRITEGFTEYALLTSWQTPSSDADGAETLETRPPLGQDTAAALDVTSTTLPLCNEQQDRVASAWGVAHFFAASNPETAPLGANLFLVLAANMHSRLALYEVALTFAPVGTTSLDLSTALCRLQLATSEAELLALFDSGASNPLNASMWGTTAGTDAFPWPPINIGDNVLSFASRARLPVSSYVAIRCSGLPPGRVALEDAHVRGYQVGLHASGGECPVDMIAADRRGTASGDGSSSSGRAVQPPTRPQMHSCSSRIGQSCTTFRYDMSLTPVVTGFDKISMLISAIGENLTISGVNFGDDINAVDTVILDRALYLPKEVNDTAMVCSMQGRVSTDTSNMIKWKNERGRGMILTPQPFYAAVAWSSYMAWMSDGLPSESQIVIVPAGNTFMLDTSPPPLTGMLLEGALIVSDESDIELQAGLITITDTGALITGSESAPRRHRFTLTLSEDFGSVEDEVAELKNTTVEPPFTKLLFVNGGALQLHGMPPARPRCTLARDAVAGATSVVVACRVTWRVGDAFAVTTSSLLTHETETRTIARREMSAARTTLFFVEPLLYNHSAGLLRENTSATNPARSGATATADMDGPPGWFDSVAALDHVTQGAHVVLLTRNVRIRGDAVSTTTAIGASVMVRNPSSCSLTNVEMYRAGKLGSLMGFAVYFESIEFPTATPIMRDCVVHQSFHRAVVLKQTQNVMVDGLTAIDIEGHGIAAIGTQHPGLSIRDSFITSLHQSRGGIDGTPTGLYLTYTGVNVTGNEIVASEGCGVWYALRSTFTSSRSRSCPALQPLTQFSDNVIYRIRRHGLLLFPFHFAMDAACATNLFDQSASATSAGPLGGSGDAENDDANDAEGSSVTSSFANGSPISCGTLERNVFASCALSGVYLPPSSGYVFRHSLIADVQGSGVVMDYSHLLTIFDSCAVWGGFPEGVMTNFTTGRAEQVNMSTTGSTESAPKVPTEEDAFVRFNRRIGFEARHGGRVDFLSVSFANFLDGTAIVFDTQSVASNRVYRDSVPAYFLQSNVLRLGLQGFDPFGEYAFTSGGARAFDFSGPGVMHDMDGKLNTNARDTYYFSDSLYMNAVPYCGPIYSRAGNGTTEAVQTNYTACYAPSLDVQLVTANPYPVVGTEIFGDTVREAPSLKLSEQTSRCNLMRVTVRYAEGSSAFALTVPSNYSENANLAPAFFFLAPQLRPPGVDVARPLGRPSSLGDNSYSQFLSMEDELSFTSDANLTVRLYRVTDEGQTECYSNVFRATVYDARSNDPYLERSVGASSIGLWSAFPTAPTLLRVAVDPRGYYFYGRNVGSTTTNTDTASPLDTEVETVNTAAESTDDEGIGHNTAFTEGMLADAARMGTATMQRVSANETLLSLLIDTYAPSNNTLGWVGATWFGKTVSCPEGEECMGPYFPFLKNFAAAVSRGGGRVASEMDLKTYGWWAEDAWLHGRVPRVCPTGNNSATGPVEPPVSSEGHDDDDSETGYFSTQLTTRQYVIPFGRRVILQDDDAEVDGALLVFGELIITSDLPTDVPDEVAGEAGEKLADRPPVMTVRIGSLAVFGRLTVKASRPSSRPIRIDLGYGRAYEHVDDYLNDTEGACPVGTRVVSCHRVRKPVRIDENTVLHCGSFYASGTVRMVGYAPAPTVWRADGVAEEGTHDTPDMHSLFEPWQAESLLATYDGLVASAQRRLPQWLSTVPVRNATGSWDGLLYTEAEMASNTTSMARRVWRRGDLVAATSSLADLNGAEVNTAASPAAFTLAYTEFGNYTEIHLRSSVFAETPESDSESGGDLNLGNSVFDSTGEASSSTAADPMMANPWAITHGAVNVNDNYVSAARRHAYSEFAVLTKRIEFDCLIPLSAPRHGCTTIITQQRLPENLFAPPDFMAVGVGFSHMGKGGQYWTDAEDSGATVRLPSLFPGLSFIPGVFVNTTASVNNVSVTISVDDDTTASRKRAAKDSSTASTEPRWVPANKPAASYASCAFVQSYGTPIYSAPRTRMLWVLDSVIWESFGGGLRLDGGGNGTRIEGVLVAGTRYYRRGQRMTTPPTRSDALLNDDSTSLTALGTLSPQTIGPVSSLCSFVVNFTTDEDRVGLSGANYDDEAFYKTYLVDDPSEAGDEHTIAVPLPSSVIARRNVFAGSESEGLCIPFERTRAFSHNTAHSNFVGIFFFHNGDPAGAYLAANRNDTAAEPEGGGRGVAAATVYSTGTSTRNAVLYGSKAFLNRYIGVYSTSHQQLTIQGASIFANSLGLVLGIDPAHRSGTTSVLDSYLAGYSNCRDAVRTAATADNPVVSVCQPSLSVPAQRGCTQGTFMEQTTDYAAVLALPSFLRVGLAYNRTHPLAVPGGSPLRGYREVYTQGSLRLVNITFGGVGVMRCQVSPGQTKLFYGAAIAGSGGTRTASSLASITTAGVAFPNYPPMLDEVEGDSSVAVTRPPVTPKMHGAWILRLSALSSRVEDTTPYDETIVRDLDGSLFTGIGRRPDVTDPLAVLSSMEGLGGVPVTVEPAVYGTSHSTLIDSAGCTVFGVDTTMLRCPDLGAPFQQLVIQSLDNRQSALEDVVLTLPSLRSPIRFGSYAAATLTSAESTVASLRPSSLVAVKSMATPPYMTSTVTSTTPVAVEVTFTPESSPDVFLVGVHSCIWALNSDDAEPTAAELLSFDTNSASFAAGFLYVTVSLMDPNKRLTVWRDGSPLEPSDDVFRPVDRSATSRVTVSSTKANSSAVTENGDGEEEIEQGDASSGTTTESTVPPSSLSSGISWNTVTKVDEVAGTVTRRLQLRVGCGTQATIHQLAYGVVSLYIPSSSEEVQSGLVRLVVAVLSASSRYQGGAITVSDAAGAVDAAAGQKRVVSQGDSFLVDFMPWKSHARSATSANDSLAPDTTDEHFNITVEDIKPDLFNPSKTFLSLRVEVADAADYDVVAATEAINGFLSSIVTVAGAENATGKSLSRAPEPSTPSAWRTFSQWVRGLVGRRHSASASTASSSASSFSKEEPRKLFSSQSPTASVVPQTGSGWVLVGDAWYAVLAVQLASSPKTLYDSTQILQTHLRGSYATWHGSRLIIFAVLLPTVLVLVIALRCIQHILQQNFQNFFSMLDATGGSQQLLARVQRNKEKTRLLAENQKRQEAGLTPKPDHLQLKRRQKALPDSLPLAVEQTDPATSAAAVVNRYVRRWQLTRESLADLALSAGGGASGGLAFANTNASSNGTSMRGADGGGGGSGGGGNDRAVFPVVGTESPRSPNTHEVGYGIGWPRREVSPSMSMQQHQPSSSAASGGASDVWGADSMSRAGTASANEGETQGSNGYPNNGPIGEHRRGKGRPGHRRIPVSLAQPVSPSAAQGGASLTYTTLSPSHVGRPQGVSFASPPVEPVDGDGGGGPAAPMAFVRPPRRLSPLDTPGSGGNDTSHVEATTEHAGAPAAATTSTTAVTAAALSSVEERSPNPQVPPPTDLTPSTTDGSPSLPSAETPPRPSLVPVVLPSLLVRRPLVNRNGVAPPPGYGTSLSDAAAPMPLRSALVTGSAASAPVATGGLGATATAVGAEEYPTSAAAAAAVAEELRVNGLHYRPPAVFQASANTVAEDRVAAGLSGGARGRRQVSFAPSDTDETDDRDDGNDSTLEPLPQHMFF